MKNDLAKHAVDKACDANWTAGKVAKIGFFALIALMVYKFFVGFSEVDKDLKKM
jgi:hypothetical protein